MGGYWKTTSFIPQAKKEYEEKGKIEFFDSNTGKLLFVAPKGRSFEDFINESNSHGWPSFRDEETVWDYVRCLPNGEAISVDGTHLGHNLPDRNGNRYCINLVSVADVQLAEENKNDNNKCFICKTPSPIPKKKKTIRCEKKKQEKKKLNKNLWIQKIWKSIKFTFKEKKNACLF